MKRLVVTDRIGRIVATGPHPEDVPGMRGTFGFAGLEAQQTHEVEMPEPVGTIQYLQDLHKTNQVSVEGGRATRTDLA